MNSRAQTHDPHATVSIGHKFNHLRSMAKNVLAPILLCHWQNTFRLILTSSLEWSSISKHFAFASRAGCGYSSQTVVSPVVEVGILRNIDHVDTWISFSESRPPTQPIVGASLRGSIQPEIVSLYPLRPYLSLAFRC